MVEKELLQSEEIIFKSNKQIELTNNSNRPTKISKNLGKIPALPFALMIAVIAAWATF
jgi:hypothetical protein